MNPTTGQSASPMYLFDLHGKPVWQTALETVFSQAAVTLNPESSTYFSTREQNSRLPRSLGNRNNPIYQPRGPMGSVPLSTDTLIASLGRRIVGSKRRSYLGLGKLVFVDSYGEKHYGFVIPGEEDEVIIEDLDQLFDGGMVASNITGSALINTNGNHTLVPFGEGEITEHGVVKVRLESEPPIYRFLPPPTPGGHRVNRPVQYVGHQNPKLNIVSLQSYHLASHWEYKDPETEEIVPIEPIKMIDPR